MQAWRSEAAAKRVGFVPTMGALHDGHVSLMRAARKRADFVVVSIYVNPTQFGKGEDFQEYPRDFDGDCAKCEAENVDIVFAPSDAEMYPQGFSMIVDEPELSKTLEGAIRPGHFRGVCTVVAKLFNIVQPRVAFFGQKDFQQTVIVKKMVRDLNFPIEIVVCPTVRESDGLALSSRNAYLKPDERKEATLLHKALTAARDLVAEGERDAEKIRAAMRRVLQLSMLLRADYVEICDPDTLKPVKEVKKGHVALLAVRFGNTRLIDNEIL
jgi:pantoate--beta-alanine ligase